MKSHQEILDSLKEEFENYQITISEHQKRVEASIVETKWATEPQFHLALLEIERARLSKGKIVDETSSNTTIKLGYDQDNRIIYEERMSNSSSGAYQKFILYNKDDIWSYKYCNQKIEGIAYQTLSKGKPVIYASYEEGKVNTVDKYFFEEDSLVRIDSFNSYLAFGHQAQEPSYLIDYNKIGDIKEIRRVDAPSDFFPNGQDIVIYKKHNYSLKALSTMLVEEVTNLIQRELIQKDLNEKNCLIVYIHNAFNNDNWLPPNFALVKAKTRLDRDITVQEFIDLESIQYPHQSQFSNRLLEIANLLMQGIELKEKYEMPSKLLVQISKIIKDWSQNSPDLANLIILPLDFPDDLYEETISILGNIYSKKEIKGIIQ